MFGNRQPFLPVDERPLRDILKDRFNRSDWYDIDRWENRDRSSIAMVEQPFVPIDERPLRDILKDRFNRSDWYDIDRWENRDRSSIAMVEHNTHHKSFLDIYAPVIEPPKPNLEDMMVQLTSNVGTISTNVGSLTTTLKSFMTITGATINTLEETMIAMQKQMKAVETQVEELANNQAHVHNLRNFSSNTEEPQRRSDINLRSDTEYTNHGPAQKESKKQHEDKEGMEIEAADKPIGLAIGRQPDQQGTPSTPDPPIGRQADRQGPPTAPPPCQHMYFAPVPFPNTLQDMPGSLKLLCEFVASKWKSKKKEPPWVRDMEKGGSATKKDAEVKVGEKPRCGHYYSFLPP